eukprot:166718-Rhodomonas_salina.1
MAHVVLSYCMLLRDQGARRGPQGTMPYLLRPIFLEPIYPPTRKTMTCYAGSGPGIADRAAHMQARVVPVLYRRASSTAVHEWY